MLARILVLLLAASCVPTQEPSSSPRPTRRGAPQPTAQASRLELSHDSLAKILPLGPAWLLQQVQVEETMRKGEFIGWRIIALPESWLAAGVQPDDVVVSVFGMPLERPEDVMAAWVLLAERNAVPVKLLRNGNPTELTFAISGAPNPGAVKGLAGEERPSAPQPPRGTVVIVEK